MHKMTEISTQTVVSCDDNNDMVFSWSSTSDILIQVHQIYITNFLIDDYIVNYSLGVIHILRNHQGGGGGFGMITLM